MNSALVWHCVSSGLLLVDELFYRNLIGRAFRSYGRFCWQFSFIVLWNDVNGARRPHIACSHGTYSPSGTPSLAEFCILPYGEVKKYTGTWSAVVSDYYTLRLNCCTIVSTTAWMNIMAARRDAVWQQMFKEEFNTIVYFFNSCRSFNPRTAGEGAVIRPTQVFRR